MFQGRFNLFICNGCGEQVITKVFPIGYVFVPLRNEVAHYCPKCKTPQHEEIMSASISNRIQPMAEQTPTFVVSTPYQNNEIED